MRKHLPLWLVLFLGLGTPFALVWLTGSQQTAHAAVLPRPLAAQTHTVGGACGATIQACIDSASPGDTVAVPAGEYVESLTLNKAVSLVGADRATTIVRALEGHRVITVTGAGVNNSVLISGLTFTGGAPSTFDSEDPCSTGCGGGMLITDTARPRLENLIFSSNSAIDGLQGGGLYAAAGSPLRLTNVDFTSNTTTHSDGGGAYVTDDVEVINGRFQGNTGGGLMTQGRLRVVGSQFIANTSGYTIIVAGAYAGGPADISNSLFESNKATALHILGTLVMTGTDFSGNTGIFFAGGVYAAGTSAITGGTFAHNSGDAGAIYAVSALQLTGAEIISNTAYRPDFGNVLVGGNATVVESRLEGNDGGAIWVIGSATILRSQFVANTNSNTTAMVEGPVTVDESEFVGNTTTGDTGGGLKGNSSGQISNSRFESNRAYGEGGALYIAGHLAMTNTDVIANESTFGHGGGVKASSLQINGGNFINNRASYGFGAGGAVTVWGGDATIEDASFIGNQAMSDGGAVWVVDGATTVVESRFENNRGGSGGGLYAGAGATLVDTDFVGNIATIANSSATGGGAHVTGRVSISGGRFESNRAGLGEDIGSGGGLYAGSSISCDQVDLSIRGTQFISNSASDVGGGVVAHGGTNCEQHTFVDVRLERNQARQGGGLYVFRNSVSLTRAIFAENVATESGGGLSVGTSAALIDSQFERNEAGASGGGIYGQALDLFVRAIIHVENCDFVDNTAGTSGGGMETTIGEIQNSLFQGNQAQTDGGGISAVMSTISTTVFLDNRAGGSGGGVAVLGNVEPTSTELTITGSRFEGNEAGLDGGGANANSYKAPTVNTTLFLDNVAGGHGGGLAIYGGNLSQVRLLGNRAAQGGGIYYGGYGGPSASYLSAENVLLADNQATGDGAAAFHAPGGNANLNHLTIAASALNPKPALAYATSCGNSSGCTQVTLRNSIVANHAIGIALGETNGPGEQGNPLFLDYLLFSDVTTPISATVSVDTGANSRRGDPDFVNPAQNDYRLGAASQARDRAESGGCPALDVEGTARPQGLGCDIGAYEGEPMSPSIALAPTSFRFIALTGMGQPPAQTLNISNIGVGTLNWSASSSAAWLSASPASGSQNGPTQVRVNHTGLAAGVYEGTLTISGNATNPEETASVQVEVLNACIPLAANGGFEAGNDGAWQESSNQSASLIRQSGEMGGLGTPHSGDYAVVLGSQNGDQNELSQPVKLPSGGALTLEYYYQINSNEENCTFDTVRLLLDDTLLAEHGLCPANNTSGWQKGTVNLAPYGNRAGSLRFTLQNDSLGNASTFLLDDVSIVAQTTATCDGPVLQVTPGALSFTAVAGGESPAAQSLKIANDGAGELAWTASESLEWLSLNSESGAADDEVQVIVDSAGLSAGQYSGQITIQGEGASGSPKTVDVNLTVTAKQIEPEPVLQVSPGSLTFTATVGDQNPPNQSITITNGGTGDLSWTAGETEEWLSLNSESGSAPSTLEVSVDISDLEIGVYNGDITVSAAGAEGSPQTIPVVLTVTEEEAVATLQVTPSTLAFTADGSNPPAQPFTIQFTGSGAWSAAESLPWLSIDAASGTTDSDVQVIIDAAGLGKGSYSGQIVVSAPGSVAQVVTVSLTIAAEVTDAGSKVFLPNMQKQ